MNSEELTIKRDRMRYIKNSMAANLALLGILANVFYFVSICKSDVDTYYYNYIIGISIIYNLVFMLAVFLSSEGVKNYKKSYSYLLAAAGVIQIVRIFIIPVKAHATEVIAGGETVLVMQNAQFTRVLVYLVVSAACLIGSAVVNYIRCGELEAHLKTLGIQGA